MIDYDSWKLSNRYEEIEPTPEGWVREEELPNFNDTRDYLQGIMEALYKDGNVEKLEDCLEELCGLYDVEFKLGVPQLEKKNENQLMHWYLDYQRASIEQRM